MGEEIRNLFDPGVTSISNIFLKKYLADVNPDYLKVYLYIMWKNTEDISVTKIADDLTLTENDVIKALKYWLKQKVGADEKITEVTKKNNSINNIEKQLLENEEKNKANKENSNEKDSDKKLAIKNKKLESDEFRELIFCSEKLMNHPISPKLKETLEYMIGDLELSFDVVNALIEYCCELDKTNPRYIKAVANDWAERNVKTVEDVKKIQNDFENHKSGRKVGKKKLKANFTQRETNYKIIEEKKAKYGIFS